jgi:formamidopyrimidine-DNA glycosylase
MPELPEVETIARLLAPAIEGRDIVAVRRLDRRIAGIVGEPGRGGGLTRVRGSSLLAGRRVTGVGRRGKALILALEPAGALVFRLGMTGHVSLEKAGAPLRGIHLHAALTLSGGLDLLYADPRRFGRVLVDPSCSVPGLGLAPDPFSPDFTWQGVAERGGRSRRTLKEVLLDQSVVSGIGNIYAAEILHRAGLSPLRRGCETTMGEWRLIAARARAVLAEAVAAGGSTVRDFAGPSGRAGAYQDEHLVYGREGQGCRACDAPILRVTQGGRSTFYCPRCQK